MLNPLTQSSIGSKKRYLKWVLDATAGMLGIGIGGTVEKAALLAKASLMESIDIQAPQGVCGASTTEEHLRLDIFDAVNQLGIGAQGLGGLTTVLDVKVKSAPTHALLSLS